MRGAAIAGHPHLRHLALGDVDSTNAEALRLAREGEPGGLWVTAERQLAGRGRHGRRWVSEPGNLHASLLLVDPAPLTQIGNLPLVAALGVYRGLKPLFQRAPSALAIKWPNDILVDGAKINGILLETLPLDRGRLAVVIGCGINCRHHPQEALYRTTDLATCGFAVGPAEMFGRLVDSMVATLAEWDCGKGFASIRAAWLQAAQGVGERVVVRLPEGELAGTFEDIDQEGYLWLRLPDGQARRISAGDLFFRTGLENE